VQAHALVQRLRGPAEAALLHRRAEQRLEALGRAAQLDAVLRARGPAMLGVTSPRSSVMTCE
jgi:hypothetical protein